MHLNPWRDLSFSHLVPTQIACAQATAVARRALGLAIAAVLTLSNQAAGVANPGGWVKHPANPVLGGNLGTCFDVALLKEDGKYRMWFSWRPKKSLALTESPDGVTWNQPALVVEPRTSTGWEDDINRPVVVKHDGLYHLWYTGQANERSWIGYARSVDGIHWVRQSDRPVLSPEGAWEKVAVMCPHVEWDEGLRQFRMWYSGGDQYEPDAIGYATSTDGLRWTKHPRNPIFRADPANLWERHKVTAAQVVRRDGWHYFFYIGFRDEDHAQIGLARSRDGLTGWERHPANPIVRPDDGGWDHDACYKPFAIPDGNRWLLWYNGRHGGVEQIGMAIHEGLDLGFPKPNASGPQAMYEEEPSTSMTIREQQWRQLEAYASHLEHLKPTIVPDQAKQIAAGAKVSPDALRQVLRHRIGYPAPGLHPTGKAQMEQVAEDDVATYFRCYIPMGAGLETYGLYIVPKAASKPVPLVIAQHGGGGFPELATFKGGGNYHDLVRGPVAQGWIVFAPLHLFYPYGDRDHQTAIPPDARERLDDRLRACGTSLAAVEVTKISRALDVLLKRREIDPRRVGMAGLSYGGFYTLYAAALEPRIRAAVASCSFVNWGDTVRNARSEPARRTGGRLTDLPVTELARLICPRALQVQCGNDDTLFAIAESQRLAEVTRRDFAQAGAGDQFSFEAFPGGHEFRGDLAWPFLRRYWHTP